MNDIHNSTYALHNDRALLERLSSQRERWLAFARKRINAADAEDAVQTAFERAFNRIDSLRDPDRLSAWFYPILRHAVADALARQSRKTKLNERLEHEACVQDPVVLPSEPDDACNCGISLMDTLLPPDQMEVLERVVLHEQPVHAVATAMDTTANTTRVRLHRARRTLQAGLEDHCGVTSAQQAHDCACPC